MPLTRSDTTRANLRPVNPANRFGLDYEREAIAFGRPIVPITDVHTHISGAHASMMFRRACDLYGVDRVYSMTHLEQMEAVRDALGERVRFIAVPNYAATEDRAHHMTWGYVDRIEAFHEAGARIAKFWAAPRSRDYAKEFGDDSLSRLDSPPRIAAMEAAAGLGMIFMTHIADPDTWFATKYRDASFYGTKPQQYEAFEKLLDRFTQPWIAAHMGGWPENLEFLSGLLERHANLYLDCSATKWQVRELGRHSRGDLIEFLRRFRGRVMFGSDIVTSDQHLKHSADDNEMVRKASSADEAFDLYASRYWSLRTLFETEYVGESPIADPDLAMVDPERFDEMSAPTFSGKALPRDLLRDLYHDAAAALLDPLHQPAG